MRVFRDDLPVAVVVAGIPSVVAVMVVLDLPWTAFFPLAVISGVAVVYAMVLQYFGIETGMRPIVDEIVSQLPPEFEFERVGLSFTAKLLAIMPLTAMLTGLTVAALARDDSLGLSVLITLGVAFTISLELVILFSKSVARPMSALRDGIRAVEGGDYAVRVPVTTSDDLGELASGFNQMAAGLEERERIREAFGTYLDKGVAEYILTRGVPGRHRGRGVDPVLRRRRLHGLLVGCRGD